MYNSNGFMKVNGSGSIVRKNITEKDDKFFGDVVLITERTHKEKVYKSYTRVKVQGFQAKNISQRLNLGDTISVSGDLVTQGMEKSAKGFDIPVTMIDLQDYTEGKLTKKTQEQHQQARANSANSSQSAPSQEAPNQSAPSQDVVSQDNQAAPSQSAPAQKPVAKVAPVEPSIDFDDDIPF